MDVVCLQNITFQRKGCTILSDVSWRIRRGEHWALLGANGSGKTSLLKIVAGYEWPTRGTVTVLGRRFGECNLPQLRKTIGWVSSALEHRIPPRDRAWDVVASGMDASLGLYRDLNDKEVRRVLAALAATGAESHADQAYGTLSQGEQQRILIARALVNRPALLILDEPCVGLDPSAREVFLGDLARLAQDGGAPTMVLVTHHIEEIGDWIGQALVLKSGRVLTQGPTQEVVTADVLGEALSARCHVERIGTRYYMRVMDS